MGYGFGLPGVCAIVVWFSLFCVGCYLLVFPICILDVLWELWFGVGFGGDAFRCVVVGLCSCLNWGVSVRFAAAVFVAILGCGVCSFCLLAF